MLLIAAFALAQLAFAIRAPLQNKMAATRRMAIHLTNGTTGNCDALIEDSPWSITNLRTFQAAPRVDSISYFAFQFEDINPGLELKTNCSYYILGGSNATLADDGYHLCANDDVQFKYDGQILQVARWYQDECLGAPPYDSAVAHGRSNVTLTKTQAQDGVLATQTNMQMPISSLS
ncbi:hypothetical protein Slin15195_G020960 [Septoria linicola]|uniref:AA1-like domain-containing protein n=1 Tax=Septoria linicola TaxID=215465 RepID=A0A9Q9AMK2_9PEZI|nr:hypothetical protein Slin14017_G021030 [Septoria linicola]USW48777.1 hypothetical protein Slin15195_G020960 [Septoria linicola]